MCLLTLQEKPKRTFRAITAYKVLESREETLVSPSFSFDWTKGKLEKTKLGIHREMDRGNVSFTNEASYHRYYKEDSVTEIAEGFHAYLQMEDAIDFLIDIYGETIKDAVIAKMKIPAFSLVFTDECRMIVSNKMKFVKVIPFEK